MNNPSVRSAQHRLVLLLAAALLTATSATLSAQVAPLAPRWLAGTPTPPVETFTDSLARKHIDSAEPALIAALQSPDGDIRSLAAAQLAAMDDHQALPAISRALDNEHDPQVRVNLAGAATWLASRHALEQLELICQDVNTPSPVRLDAARYVSNRESPACFPAIKEIERDSQDPAIRVQALFAAQCYRGQADGAAALAISALADLDPSVRIAAADALRLLHATRAVGPLGSALQVDGDDTAREHLREAIRVLNLPDPAH